MIPKNEIWFKEGRGWIVPTPTLGNKLHTFQNTKGKIVNLGDLNIVKDQFYGGNYTRLVFVEEYGFYMCPMDDQDSGKLNNLVTGFYIHDPKQVTDKGKKLVTDFYKKMGKTVHFDYYKEPEATEKELNEWEETKKNYIKEGLDPKDVERVDRKNAEELNILLRAQKVGRANIKVDIEPVNVSPASTETITHYHSTKKATTK